jgi:hypothetical protein
MAPPSRAENSEPARRLTIAIRVKIKRVKGGAENGRYGITGVIRIRIAHPVVKGQIAS